MVSDVGIGHGIKVSDVGIRHGIMVSDVRDWTWHNG